MMDAYYRPKTENQMILEVLAEIRDLLQKINKREEAKAAHFVTMEPLSDEEIEALRQK